MNLTSETIVFVLAGEINAIKSLKNDLHTFSRLCKHWFNWDANSNIALIFEFLILITNSEKNFYNLSIVWVLTNCLLDCKFNLFCKFKELFVTKFLFLIQNFRFVWWCVRNGSCQGNNNSFFGCTCFKCFLKKPDDVLGFIVGAILQEF